MISQSELELEIERQGIGTTSATMVTRPREADALRLGYLASA